MISRALVAHYTDLAFDVAFALKHDGYEPREPPISFATPVVGGKQYVVLRSVMGIERVYSVRADGTLNALKRWPKAIEGEAS